MFRSAALAFVKNAEDGVRNAQWDLSQAVDELRDAYELLASSICDHQDNVDFLHTQRGGGRWYCHDCREMFTPSEADQEQYDAHRVYYADLHAQHDAGLMEHEWVERWLAVRNGS